MITVPALRRPQSNRRFRVRALLAPASVALLCACLAVLLAGLSVRPASAAFPKKSAEQWASALRGTWRGAFLWTVDSAYLVELRVLTTKVDGDKVTFTARQTADNCRNIVVRGVFSAKTRSVALDETSTNCADYKTDGIYRGTVSPTGATMSLVWTSDEFERNGALVLEKVVTAQASGSSAP